MSALLERLRNRPACAKSDITQEEVEELRQLVAQFGLRKVATMARLSNDTIKCKVDPEYHERRREQVRLRRRELRAGAVRRVRREAVHRVDDHRDVPRNPLYDPGRDGPQPYCSPFAEMLGEPPAGRRQMLEENARRTAPPVSGVPLKPWHF